MSKGGCRPYPSQPVASIGVQIAMQLSRGQVKSVEKYKY
jgi:hypothetical protein